MRVETFLRESARKAPERTALVAGGTRLSYAALEAMSDRLAAGLAQNGLTPGARALVVMDNIREMPVALFAALKAGAVVCPVNPSLKADGLRAVLAGCRPQALVTQGRHLRICAEAARGMEPPLRIAARAEAPLPAGVRAWEDCMAEPGAESGPVPRAGSGADELAMLVHTSGSTGAPKGVMMTHGNVEAASRLIAGYLENTADDVVLNTLPLSFTYGLYQLLVSVRTGATLVLEKGFAYPHAVLRTARAEGVTGLPLVPATAALILSLKDMEPDMLPRLRYITNAAAPLPPAHADGLAKLFPRARLYSMYGLSECARATFLPPFEIARRPGSVGRALPQTQAFVVDESGSPAPPGAVGELVVRGPHVMKGYWRDAAATRRALRPAPDGGSPLLYTGDLFRADADGFLYFVGRRDDMIKIGGEKVAPGRVEDVLQACPGVREAVVFGVPDPVLGQVLQALVVADDPPPAEREVRRHCARRLPDFMVPKTIHFRPALPRTASGKTSRRQAAMEATQTP